MRSDQRERLINRLVAWAGETQAPALHARLSDEEILRLSRSPLISIGGHTVTHTSLAILSAAEQEDEISANKAHLESITGRRVTAFAYPFGDIGTATLGAVRASGYRCACSVSVGAGTAAADPLRLPRCQVPDVGGDAFGEWLDAAWRPASE
jgi:peptidoglycan/xylan/chitin deacetylase (PgdA/CDA1 family)